MLVRPAMKRLFCLKAKKGIGRFAPSALPHYYLICKFQKFFSFWIACDIPNIEVDTKEQVAGHNQPDIYIYTYRRQNTQIQYPRHREKP